MTLMESVGGLKGLNEYFSNYSIRHQHIYRLEHVAFKLSDA